MTVSLLRALIKSNKHEILTSLELPGLRKNWFSWNRSVNERRIDHLPSLVFHLLPVAIFLLFVFFFYSDNFIDDTYIHLSYASNLLDGRGWSFARNITPSYGTTSPLWVGLLAGALAVARHALPALTLAKLCSIAFGALTVLMVSHLTRSFGWTGFVITVGFALDPNLARYASTGMETSLSVGLTLVATGLALQQHTRESGVKRGLLFGLVSGGLYLLRPETAALVVAFLIYRCSRGHFRFLLAAILAGGVTISPWLLYSYLAFGQLLPNTAYAKGLYLPLGSTTLVAFLERFGPVALLASIWAAVPLLIGWTRSARNRNRQDRIEIGVVAAVVFALCSYSGAFWLTNSRIDPRYIVVVFSPVTWWLLIRTGLKRYDGLAASAVVSAVVCASILVTWLIYLPAKSAYVSANRGLVEIGQWLQVETPSDARIAVADIGAVGFWSKRYVLDLDGLASKEAIPFYYGHGNWCELVDREMIGYLVIRRSDERWKQCAFSMVRLYTVDYPIRTLGVLERRNEQYGVWRIERF